jgi:DNA replication and repair protein RecF
MYCQHISLANFRNYVRLELDLPPGLSLFIGGNAQGKSNLLEAVYYLSTAKSHRATAEREVINWLAMAETQPFARVAGRVHREGSVLDIEIVLVGRQDTAAPKEWPQWEQLGEFNNHDLSVQKRFKVNGMAKRAVEIPGLVNAVMFCPPDLEIVNGAPAFRRRYLDVTLSQIDSRYCRCLQRYNKVLVQRNHLLRRLRDRPGSLDQLVFWNRELVASGAYLALARDKTVRALDEYAHDIHGQLTGKAERLRMTYDCSVGWNRGQLSLPILETSQPAAEAELEARIASAFAAQLQRQQKKELSMGMSLVGPHRDDLTFRVNGVDMNVYGSRGQQRTVALSLRLAQLRLMEDVARGKPLLLLDDVLSELDEPRRHWLREALDSGHQVLITATDTSHFPADFLAKTSVFTIQEGAVVPLEAVGLRGHHVYVAGFRRYQRR